ncbi:hypothetical protein B0J17DRAFT_629908 [Rhizoctonia solani]|nr:hypothetical protein B0J17DRAFT_629908 [Rhizoctonia solani]
MIEELSAARQQLQTALDKYGALCSDAQNFPSLRNAPRDDSLRQIDAEMALLASYESKIREARRAIGAARNYSLKLTLINILPSERRIVNSSPSLWVHVDLAICKALHELKALVNRAQTHATRSAGLPLQIHIAEQEAPSLPFGPESYIRDILHPIIGRMEGLEFNTRGKLDEFHNSVLQAILSGCSAQKFNKLAINSTHGQYNNFIESNRRSVVVGEEGESYLQLSLAPNDIERGFNHLSVLHLAGFFPRWTSVAYHGLVDLRLTSPHSIFWSWIKEPDLISVLRASPALRILFLQLDITDRHPDYMPIIPVHLNHLEVLSIITDSFWTKEEDPPAEAGKLLRFIVPGLRPLRFIFQTIDYANDRSFEEVKNFFMRSNVLKFCSHDAYPPLDELLSHSPNLQTLVFRGCIQRDSSKNLVSPINRGAENPLNWGWKSW